MLILSKENIKASINMQEAISASAEALRLYTQKQAHVPLRTNLDVSQFKGQSLYMPAVTAGSLNALGVKIVSVYPENLAKGLPSVPSTMVVQDPETGIVSAILDGTYLTQLRTAAVQGVATNALARLDAQIAALIGTGGQGLQQAIAMMTVRPLKELRVFDLQFERAEAFAKHLQEEIADKFDTTIVPVASAKEAVLDADIITSVTTSRQPTFAFADVKAGAHINGVGAYTPDMIELPNELIASADCLLVDTKEGVLSEAGDIITPLEKGLITENNITGELGQLLLGQVKGRQHSDDITVFKTVGTAILDVVTAQVIVEKALHHQQGTSIDF